MRLSAYGGAAAPDQEVEVGTGVGLLHVVDGEPFPAAAWVREPVEHRGARYPLLEDVVGHVELEPPRGDVEHDEVAILDEGQRAAGTATLNVLRDKLPPVRI